MTRRVVLAPLVALFCCFVGALPSLAAVPSDELLPNTTKGYLAVENMAKFREAWEATQLGQLVADPIMKEFVEDLQGQLRSKLGNSGERLGVEFSDIQKLCDGEFAVALVQPGGDKNQHAMVILLDVSGKDEELAAWQTRLQKKMAAEKAKRATHKVGDIEVVTYTRPVQKEHREVEHLCYFAHAGQLVTADHEKLTELLAKRIPADAKRGEALVEVESYKAIVSRVGKSQGELKPHVKYFVEPFGYAEVTRAASGGKKKRGTDMLKVLANQGFKAVQGVGGYLTLNTGTEEILHRALVYAPRDPKAEAKDKYRLAARMLDLPNGQGLKPQSWVLPTAGTWMNFNLRIPEAFEYVSTLVDEIAGEPGVFEDVIKSIAVDKNGPQVNLRKDLVAHSDGTVTIFSDCQTPITVKSERLAVAFGTKNPAAVAKAIEKIMKAEPNAHLRKIDGHDVWEIINEEESITVESIKIEGAEFTSTEEDEDEQDSGKRKKSKDADEEAEEKHVIPNSAVTVVDGHLIWATHIDLIKEILLLSKGNANTLRETKDYVEVDQALRRLANASESFRSFIRTDEAYHTTYELLRQGKMPESETMLGKLLNRVMGSEDEDEVREQEIDGSKMPPFEAVRKYLGPAGTTVESEDDGWFIVSCLLKKAG